MNFACTVLTVCHFEIEELRRHMPTLSFFKFSINQYNDNKKLMFTLIAIIISTITATKVCNSGEFFLATVAKDLLPRKC